MRILVDLDGIVADLLPEWLRLYNEDYGDSLSVADVHDYNMLNVVRPECGERIVDDYLNRPGLFENLEPIPGAIKSLKWMQDHGHEVIIASMAPTPESAKGKHIWVKKHLPFISKKQVVLLKQKWLLRGDGLIDDDPKNLEEYLKYNGISFLGAIQYPYNKGKIEEFADAVGVDYRTPEAAWDQILAGFFGAQTLAR